MSVGNVSFTSSAASTVAIDSSISLIYLNQNFYNALIEQFFSYPECFDNVNTSNFRTCYCNRTWPMFLFTFGNGVSVNLSSPYYVFNSPLGNGYCFMTIAGQNFSNIIALGTFFFKGYIISFDRINNRIGFYNKGNPGNGSSSTGVFDTFGPFYFVLSQYIIGGLSFIVAIMGISLWKLSGKKIKEREEK